MHYNYEWLIQQFDDGAPLKYVFFWSHINRTAEEVGKFVFSQWYEAPFTVDGITYPTAEHWMMAGKASLFGDTETFDKIVASKKPGEVKELGRQVIGFDEAVWNETRFEIVKTGNIHKFNQHPALLKFLLRTGDRILVEATPVDNVWGIGLAADAPMIEDPYTWKGTNLLGFALMEARDFLRRN